MKYSRRCAEVSAVQAYIKQGLPSALGIEIANMVKDAMEWEVDPAKKRIRVRSWLLCGSAG
jgi:hypothetical protein